MYHVCAEDTGGSGNDIRVYLKEETKMDNLGDGLKKVLLAGIGAVAVTAEKSKEILDEMVKRGELTVEQGKVLNKELKHNIRKTVKENVKVSVKPSSPEELSELLDQMTPEQIEALKAGIQEKEEKQKAESEKQAEDDVEAGEKDEAEYEAEEDETETDAQDTDE